MEISNFLQNVKAWAMEDNAVSAVILVGTHARGEAGPESDVDLVIITTDPDAYLDASFAEGFGRGLRFEEEDWGRVTSIRAWYAESGMEVEFGFASPDWLDEPLDEGTFQVLQGGYQVIVDKADIFSKLSLTE